MKTHMQEKLQEGKMLTNMSLWAMAAAAADLPFLTVFVLGFGTVFVGLLALILIITLLGKILGRSTAKKAEQAAKAMPAQQPAAPVAAAVEPEPAPEPVVDQGYPSTVELSNGDLFTTYYQHAPGDDFPSVLYTRWSLKEIK